MCSKSCSARGVYSSTCSPFMSDTCTTPSRGKHWPSTSFRLQPHDDHECHTLVPVSDDESSENLVSAKRRTKELLFVCMPYIYSKDLTYCTLFAYGEMQLLLVPDFLDNVQRVFGLCTLIMTHKLVAVVRNSHVVGGRMTTSALKHHNKVSKSRPEIML